MKRLEELQDHVNNIVSQEEKDSTKKIRELWENFDDLCLSLSRLDGKMSFTEIKSLSVYDFHKFKNYLRKLHRPKNALDKND